MITFCYDRIRDGVGHPNLALHQAEPYTVEWRQFDCYWPRTVPLRLLMYYQNYQIQSADTLLQPAWYPVGIGWFDFALDYFGMLSPVVQHQIKTGVVKVLFYYHEGDNPASIKNQLDRQVQLHSLPANCYHFISANTMAAELENFSYFPDHEFFFRHVNRHQLAETATPKYDFTVLNRLHKWWRASGMCDLQRRGILNNSIWSYNTANSTCVDLEQDNPIELDSKPGWRQRTHEFLQSTPRYCDTLSSTQHNDHHHVNTELYTQSRCHVVFETLFDVDQSGGAFLTEKTFKAIKYGQPFVLVGGVGSLQALREMGYKTFDQIIDGSYDLIKNNTDRWNAIAATLENLQQSSGWWEACQSDVVHNQKIFELRTSEPVNRLIKDLTCLQ